MENENTNDIFYKWNESKININENPIRPFYQEREIWWAATGINNRFKKVNQKNGIHRF
jgi:hypothetical protein